MSSPNPLETAFKPARSMTERVNVVGELVDIKVSSLVDADFSVQVGCEKTITVSLRVMPSLFINVLFRQ